MSEFKGKFALVVLTQNEARIWDAGLDKNLIPDRIFAPDAKASHHHVRQTQHQGGHSADPKEWGFFDVIAEAVKPASEILLISHGEGKANAALRFIQFMERNNPEIAKKIIGATDADLSALTENQLLSLARDWFERFHRNGIRSAQLR